MRRAFSAFVIMLLVSHAVCDDFSRMREKMVDEQILSRGITDTKTLNAMLTVPRHLFVPEDLQDEAYADYPLPIGYGQTISQPYIVALMTSSLKLKGDEKALEIGTGSGYQAAILAEIVNEVYTMEIIPELAQRAETALKDLGYTNVAVQNTDGYFGWEEHEPYDVIIITAAVDHIPPPLLQQLKEGGRLILPLGNPFYYQVLTLVEKQGGELYAKHISDVQFVPMTGYAQEAEESLEKLSEKYEEPAREGLSRTELFGIAFLGILILVIALMVARKKIQKS